jgi:hypothetical protein
MSATNAKTVAATRKQAPVVAENLLMDRACNLDTASWRASRVQALPSGQREATVV